ncbi:hypothetical protein BH10PSE9_BH10PSE9_14780 [soil metagenome]
MKSPPFDAEAHVRHMAEVMGLTILPEWRPNVVANIAVTAANAELLAAFPLPDHIEPAPVFEA